MERDLIREIHELTKQSVHVDEDETSNLETDAHGESDAESPRVFSPLDTATFTSAPAPEVIDPAHAHATTVKTLSEEEIRRHRVRVKPEPAKTPAQPEHFESHAIPVLEVEHKTRTGVHRRQQGSFSPILREKPKS